MPPKQRQIKVESKSALANMAKGPVGLLPPLFFDGFLAQFTFGGEQAAVNYAKRVVLFVVTHGVGSAVRRARIPCQLIAAC